eukprot:830017-Rhodomonas_salina.3
MFKQQLITKAQPYCSEPMKENHFAGRDISGWKSMGRLVEHAFVDKVNKFGDRRAAAYNRGPQDEYRLTDKGARFIEEVLKKWPTQFIAAPPASGNGGVPMQDYRDDLDALNGSPQRRRAPSASPGTGAASSGKKLFRKDADELREWAATASAGDEREFRVGKDRRQSLHRLCELIGGLNTQSFGEGRGRTLMVVKTGDPLDLSVRARSASVDRGASSNVNRSANPHVHRRPAAAAAMPSDVIEFLESHEQLLGLDGALGRRPGQHSGLGQLVEQEAGVDQRWQAPKASVQASGAGHRLGQDNRSSPAQKRADKAVRSLTPQQRAALAAEKRLAEARAQGQPQQQQQQQQHQHQHQQLPQPQQKQSLQQQQQQQKQKAKQKQRMGGQMHDDVIEEVDEEDEDSGSDAGARGVEVVGGAGARRELEMVSNTEMMESESEDEEAMMEEAKRMSLEQQQRGGASEKERGGGSEGARDGGSRASFGL